MMKDFSLGEIDFRFFEDSQELLVFDKNLPYEQGLNLPVGELMAFKDALDSAIEQIAIHKAEPSNLKVLPLRIRGVHPYVFRSGEWATVVGVAKCCSESFPDGRQCYKVRFDDGVIDYWLISEISKDYETKYEVEK